jgi:hypothetical protein
MNGNDCGVFVCFFAYAFYKFVKDNNYNFLIKDVGVPNNKLSNLIIRDSFTTITNSSVFTDIKNEFAYANRFREDMRTLFIGLNNIYRTYKSPKAIRQKEKKKRKAAYDTNIEDDMNNNKKNQISTKNDDANTDDKDNQDLKEEAVINNTMSHEDNKTITNQSADSIANNGTDADDEESIEDAQNEVIEKVFEQKDKNINNNIAEPHHDTMELPYQPNTSPQSNKKPKKNLNGSDSDSSNVSQVTCLLNLKKFSTGTLKKKGGRTKKTSMR